LEQGHPSQNGFIGETREEARELERKTTGKKRTVQERKFEEPFIFVSGSFKGMGVIETEGGGGKKSRRPKT